MQKFNIDDLLSFEYNNTKFNVKIVKINGSALIVRNIETQILTSLRVNNNNRYTLANRKNVKNFVVLKPATFPFDQLSIYLQLNILIHADYKTFLNLYKTNKQLSSICCGKLSKDFRLLYGNIDESFYQEKCETFISKQIISFRLEENLSWREFYYRVMNLNAPFNHYSEVMKYMQKGSLLELKIINTLSTIFSSEYRLNYVTIFRNCIRNGDLHILKWLHKEFNKTPESIDIICAIDNNRFEICEWFESINILPTTWSEYYSIPNLKMLLWLVDRGYKPNWKNAYRAVSEGLLDMLGFLIDRKVYPPPYSIKNSIIAGHLHILEYFYANPNLFTYEGVKTEIDHSHLILAGVNGHAHILKFLDDKGIKMDSEAFNEILERWETDHIDVLEFYYKKGIVPSTKGLFFLAVDGRLESLKWLYNKGVQMIYPVNDIAIISNERDLIDWVQNNQKN